LLNFWSEFDSRELRDLPGSHFSRGNQHFISLADCNHPLTRTLAKDERRDPAIEASEKQDKKLRQQWL
jgi:hypothetical protein